MRKLTDDNVFTFVNDKIIFFSSGELCVSGEYIQKPKKLYDDNCC